MWWSSVSANRHYDQALEAAYTQAMRTAATYPQDRKDNYRRFMHLKEIAKGTRFEELIDKEIEKILPHGGLIEQ
jgi:hypothetical protein